MNKNKFVGFDTLKQSVPIIRVLEHYGLAERLHRSGENLNGVCPLHHGHNRLTERLNCFKLHSRLETSNWWPRVVRKFLESPSRRN